ncbi:hypothetical protein VaNZ11_003900 [Volvox africanus]|uniref:CBF1-interacting co-repressor CIR N-terminal domain-containing protein n=1 Tax=Volvox africanus TaxID=51714 RepID=A0ABQ5RVF4_9CHLO|nr:hypothetical protein VaNZ11_003900 [Volvox africanus]
MEHIFGRAPKGPAPPARGAVAGVKADLERAKEGFDPRNPQGMGMAWTHHFLNQKPWHPMNFKNRMRVWEAEHDKSEANKAKEKAQAEFDAEQEYLKTLSYLSAEEQQRYREVQSISFMYTKPPGLDAALVRDAEAEKKKSSQQQQQQLHGRGVAAENGGVTTAATVGRSGALGRLDGPGGSSGREADTQQQRSAIMERLREDPFAALLAAREALQNNPRLVVSQRQQQREGGAFGGLTADHPSQQLLGEEPGTSGQGVDELELLMQLPSDQQLKVLKKIAKRSKKEEQMRKLHEAEAVLRAAGYDLSAMEAVAGGGSSGGVKHSGREHKKKRSKSKHQQGGKSRKGKRRRHSDSPSPSSSD